ncbi:MAG: DUF3299 domain-containing protein [Magnetococcus sp. THC-1_WYH]
MKRLFVVALLLLSLFAFVQNDKAVKWLSSYFEKPEISVAIPREKDSVTPHPPEPPKREEIQPLRWTDLIPDDFHPEKLLGDEKFLAMDDSDPEAKKIMDAYLAEVKRAPTVQTWNGRLVRIPGYIVPLETDGKITSEFLLVPYFGACIHVPPPPANQIIYVRAMGEGTATERSWYDTVWVIGRLTVESMENNMGNAAYTIAAQRIEPYQEQDDPDRK